MTQASSQTVILSDLNRSYFVIIFSMMENIKNHITTDFFKMRTDTVQILVLHT